MNNLDRRALAAHFLRVPAPEPDETAPADTRLEDCMKAVESLRADVAELSAKVSKSEPMDDGKDAEISRLSALLEKAMEPRDAPSATVTRDEELHAAYATLAGKVDALMLLLTAQSQPPEPEWQFDVLRDGAGNLLRVQAKAK